MAGRRLLPGNGAGFCSARSIKGGEDVGEVGTCGDALVARGIRMANDHGDAHGVFVEALLLPYTVVPTHFAVVADVDDNGIVAQG